MLSLVTVGEEGAIDRRVACAMVRFTPSKPAAWEMAVRPGQNPASLPVGKFFGYGVDAGMGCFIDADTLQALSKERAWEFYEQCVLGEMHKGGEYRDWANIVIDQDTGGNLVVFSSGYGDGVYPSYWGVSATGELCCLVTDFAILVEYLKGKATFRLYEWLGKAISHPDLSRIGLTVRLLPLGALKQLTIRLLPLGAQKHHGLRVQLEGHCKAVIVNAGKEYSSDRLPYSVSSGIGIYDFRFDEALQPDTQITLEYGLGVQALECVAK